MKAMLSILSLYNYDTSIFDNLVLPLGMEKDDVINNMLLELAELEVIYANPDMMKAAIGFWSKKELPVWTKLFDTTNFEYNPLWNLNRTDTITDKQTRNLSGSNNETRNLSGSDNETRNLAGTENETRDLGGSTTRNSTTTGTTTNSGTDTQKEFVSGFNETTPTLAKQTDQTLGTGNTVSGTVSTTDTVTDTGTDNKATSETGTLNHVTSDNGTVNNATSDTGTVENDNTQVSQGTIGVITTQNMIGQERDIVKFNMVNYIIDSFKRRFCILVY